jgi:tRNA threonylcarbamoyladenosine biosynthesis protein TsaB
MLLAIDTSSRYGGVAIADPSGMVVEARLWRSQYNHTAQLMPAVASLLETCHAEVSDLAGVGVALGPGPFSALRVGVSAAKGLAMAAGLPIVGIDTLALEAGRHLNTGGATVAWLDAGRHEVAAGWFDVRGRRIRDDELAEPGTLLAGDAIFAGATTYCGEAAYRLADTIGESGAESARAVAPWTPADRLWTLAARTAQCVQHGETDDLDNLQPYYLRMPSIGAPKQRDQVAQGRPASARP